MQKPEGAYRNWLSPREDEVVWLMTFRCRNVDDAAKVCFVNRETIRSHLARAATVAGVTRPELPGWYRQYYVARAKDRLDRNVPDLAARMQAGEEEIDGFTAYRALAASADEDSGCIEGGRAYLRSLVPDATGALDANEWVLRSAGVIFPLGDSSRLHIVPDEEFDLERAISKVSDGEGRADSLVRSYGLLMGALATTATLLHSISGIPRMKR